MFTQRDMWQVLANQFTVFDALNATASAVQANGRDSLQGSGSTLNTVRGAGVTVLCGSMSWLISLCARWRIVTAPQLMVVMLSLLAAQVLLVITPIALQVINTFKTIHLNSDVALAASPHPLPLSLD